MRSTLRRCPRPAPASAAAAVQARRYQHQEAGPSSSTMVPVPPEQGWRQQEQQQGGKRKGINNPALQRIAWRKWLSHPGVPGGTLFEREQMAAQMRRAETAQKIQKFKVKRFGGRDEEIEETGQEGNKTMRGQQGGIMNIVEDKINLAMIRGEFEALPGKGKPLERERTPGLDRTTDLFMDVLKRNGVLPEWIQRQKRVADMTSLLRRRLEIELAVLLMEMNPEAEKAHAAAQDALLSRHPTREAFTARVAGIRSVGEDLAVINSEIDTYNLQVPALHLQKMRLRLDPLISEAMLNPPTSYRAAYQAYRAASREGLMGCTCLMEHRLDSFFEGEDGDTYYVGGGGRDSSLYYTGGARKHKRSDPAADHISELLMIPIDSLARALSRMFSI